MISKEQCLKITSKAHRGLQISLMIVELIAVSFVIYITHHIIHFLTPKWIINYNNSIIIINNIKTFDFSIYTTKIWGTCIGENILYGIILIFLYMWMIMGIIGAISWIYRVIQFLNDRFKTAL